MVFWTAIIVTIIGGLAGALQARVLGNVYSKVGFIGNLWINFLFGFILAVIIVVGASLFYHHHPWKIITEIKFTERIKIWEVTGGMLGLIIITSLGYGSHKIGVSGTLIVFLSSQLIVGMIIDYFGLFSEQAITFTPLKIFSVALMCLGVFLFFKQ